MPVCTWLCSPTTPRRRTRPRHPQPQAALGCRQLPAWYAPHRRYERLVVPICERLRPSSARTYLDRCKARLALLGSRLRGLAYRHPSCAHRRLHEPRGTHATRMLPWNDAARWCRATGSCDASAMCGARTSAAARAAFASATSLCMPACPLTSAACTRAAASACSLAGAMPSTGTACTSPRQGAVDDGTSGGGVGGRERATTDACRGDAAPSRYDRRRERTADTGRRPGAITDATTVSTALLPPPKEVAMPCGAQASGACVCPRAHADMCACVVVHVFA
jgi:hypothetical protein